MDRVMHCKGPNELHLMPTKQIQTIIMRQSTSPWRHGSSEEKLWGVWLPAPALSQALHVRERTFDWLAYLPSQAPHVQKASRSQALLKRRNRPFLPGLAQVMRASTERCTTREIEIREQSEPNRCCCWPSCSDPGNQTRCYRMHRAWPKLAWLAPCELGSTGQRTKQLLNVLVDRVCS
jgi:hypothetical protein